MPKKTATVTAAGLYHLHSRRFAGTAWQAGSLRETLDTTHPLACAHSLYAKCPSHFRPDQCFGDWPAGHMTCVVSGSTASFPPHTALRRVQLLRAKGFTTSNW